MLDSYFFIPGDKSYFLSKINTINADYIVLDLEDAVSFNNKQSALNLVLELEFKKKMYLRIPFFDECYTINQIRTLIRKFEGQIVIPKISSVEDLNKIVSICEEIKLRMVVLIESPSGFLATPEILKVFSSQIEAIGFGSHDFCSITGIKHSLEYLAHYKRQLILYAKAFNVAYIDGVDLNLENFADFKKECLFAFESGADGKFIIHPKQLEEFHSLEFMSQEEIFVLKSVYEKIKDISSNAIDVITIEGKAYEKPQIERIKYLIKKVESFKQKK